MGISQDNNEILIRIDERQQDMINDIQDIKHRLFGNGHVGMCIEIAELRNTLRNVKGGLILGFTIITIIIAILNYIKI